jgi:hypothetical protein
MVSTCERLASSRKSGYGIDGFTEVLLSPRCLPTLATSHLHTGLGKALMSGVGLLLALSRNPQLELTIHRRKKVCSVLHTLSHQVVEKIA